MVLSLPLTRLYFSLVIAFTALLLTGVLGFRWLVSYPEELAFLTARQQQGIDSISAALDLNRRNLGVQTVDYARWDDSWNYMENRNEDFLSSNFVADTFSSLDLVAALFIDASGEPVVSFIYDPESGNFQRNPSALDQQTKKLQTYGLLGEQVQSATTLLQGQPMLVASSPVTHSDGTLPGNGWLVFWRSASQDFFADISRISRLEVELDAATEGPMLTTPLTRADASHVVCLPEPDGRPAWCIRIRFPDYQTPIFIGINTSLMIISLALVPALFFWLILHLLVSPLRDATTFLESSVRVRSIRSLPKPQRAINIQEISHLIDAYNQLTHTVLEQKLILQQLSHTDSLTGISNRRAFDQALDRTWLRLTHNQQSIALVQIDIDHFKRYNDSEGHIAGDEVLRKVSARLREQASHEDELAARTGGEEFTLLLHAHSTLEMEQLRRRLRETIAELQLPHPDSPVSGCITISFGIAWIRNSGEWLISASPTDWMAAADSALYEAKDNGRNTSVLKVFDRQHPLPVGPIREKRLLPE